MSKHTKELKAIEKLCVRELEKKFPEQSEYVKLIEDTPNHCICSMPVKSGKRIVMEILSQRSQDNEPKMEQHIFITSLNRKDTKEQLKELNEYGIKTIIIGREESVPRAKKEIEKYIAEKLKVIVHFDESDYGTAKQQLMDNIFQTLIKFDLNQCKIISYSATNEEAELSKFGKISKRLPDYIPASNYRGAGWFLDNNLVIPPAPFFNDGLTEQGKEALNYFMNSEKPISVLRVASTLKELEKNEKFADELRGYGVSPFFIDGKRSFDWSKSYIKHVKDVEAGGLKVLLVICQTCSRSTEVKFHKHICFWHDYRGKKTAYNTMAQAFLRVVHYQNGDEPENLIRVYAVPEVFEFAARRITVEQFESCDYIMSERIQKGSKSKKYEQRIANNINDIPDEGILVKRKKINQYETLGDYITVGERRREKGNKWTPPIQTISGHKKNSLARDIINGSCRGNITVIHIDGPSTEHYEDFKELKKVHPDWIGLFVYYIEVEQTVSMPTTSEESMFE